MLETPANPLIKTSPRGRGWIICALMPWRDGGGEDEEDEEDEGWHWLGAAGLFGLAEQQKGTSGKGRGL